MPNTYIYIYNAHHILVHLMHSVGVTVPPQSSVKLNQDQGLDDARIPFQNGKDPNKYRPKTVP